MIDRPNRFVAASEVHKLLVDVDQQASHGGTHVGVVASVIGEEVSPREVGLIKHHGLDGGGTDVQSTRRGFGCEAGFTLASVAISTMCSS